MSEQLELVRHCEERTCRTYRTQDGEACGCTCRVCTWFARRIRAPEPKGSR